MATSPGSRPRPAFLVDTNVILDVILERRPWAADAALLLDAVARRKVRGYVAGHAVPTVHYIVEKEAGRAAANTGVSDLLQVLSVVPLEMADFQRALAMQLRDFEDAVQVAACLKVGADYLVTRNGKDFKGAPAAVRTPGEVLATLAAPR
ncbi:MAG: PIN domain-containing protein [Gemmatimonadaceae bacterium]